MIAYFPSSYVNPRLGIAQRAATAKSLAQARGEASRAGEVVNARHKLASASPPFGSRGGNAHQSAETSADARMTNRGGFAVCCVASGPREANPAVRRVSTAPMRAVWAGGDVGLSRRRQSLATCLAHTTH